MGNLKISILEKDGEEFQFPVEMDLIEALSFVGFTGSGFNENLILVNQFFDVLCDQNGNVLIGVQ